MKKKKGFTLIELIAVLVILAILALIVTPLVMNIIRKARISADKRSVDAYGRSVELAIANYLLDNGDFPTDVSQLTIEYSGDEVACSTTQLNSDSSVYLAGCTVGGRSVEYTYGKEESIVYNAYEVGDEVTYNNVDYHVIKDSDATESTVTLLKAEPLTVDEVNQFGAGHVNMYNCDVNDTSCYHTAYNNNGYGGMAYYSSVDCGYGTESNSTLTGCKNDYESSEIKYVVDAWKTAQAPSAIEARLFSKDEYQEYCVKEEYQSTPSDTSTRYVPQYDWMFNNNYLYWTNTPYTDSSTDVWFVGYDGDLVSVYTIYSSNIMVRPVIVLPKSALN